MRFRFIKRPNVFVQKMGRFLMGALFAHSSLAIAQNETPIVIEDEEEQHNEAPPPRTFASSFFVKPRAEFRLSLRPNSGVLGFPAIGLFDLSAGYQPLSELDIQLSAFARVPTQTGSPHVDAFLDVYDAYVRLRQPNLNFTLGCLRTPWQVLRGSAVNDRLNPVDYRRGIDFSPDTKGKLPMWGFQARGQLWGFSLDGVYYFWRRPNPASFVFEEQDGVQIGHYQGGLAATRAELASLIGDVPVVQPDLPWFSQPSLGFAIRRQFGDFDTGLNVVWGFEEVPRLALGTTQMLASAHRSVSVGGELSVTMGVVILKAEAVVTPRIADDVGKATLVRSASTLSTESLSGMTLAFGADGEYGDWLSGSIELLSTSWFNVPPNTYVYTIEEPTAPSASYRFVTRLALVLALEGKAFNEFLAWNYRGEVGLWRPDLLSTFDLAHTFGDTGFYAGVYTNLFFGAGQTPGWFRTQATEVGLKVGFAQ